MDSDDAHFAIFKVLARTNGALEDMEYASSFAFIEHSGSGQNKLILAADYLRHTGDLKDAEAYKSIKDFEAAHAEEIRV